VKNKKSSTTVIEVGGEMRIKMAHDDATSMTKYSEVKSRAKRITTSSLRLSQELRESRMTRTGGPRFKY
jgi:hypothetical protein